MKFSTLHPAGMALVALMTCGTARAAGEDWQHTLVAYMVGASIDGETGVGAVEGDLDVGFDDILDHLEFGAMMAYRAERGRWAVVADLIYMGLEQEKDGLGPAGRTRAKVDADQLITELDLAYAISERLDLYGGLRYWNLDTDLDIAGGGPLGATLSASTQEDWIDPLIGLRLVLPLGGNWSLVARGDVGGLGVGSDFAWHASVFADWRFAGNASLLVGARLLDVKYDEGSGADRFLWDVTEGGPAAGVAWRF